MTGSFIHSGPSRRYLALATCALFVGALLLAQAHRILVRHAYCSEHGELIHPETGTDDAQGLPGVGRTRLHSEHWVEGNHGCLALTFITSSCLETAPRGPEDKATPAGDAPAPSDHGAQDAISRLSQAPKHSPPLG